MIIRGEQVALRPMTVAEIPLFYQWATQSDSAPLWYEDGRIPTYEEFTRDWKRYYFDGSEPEKGRCFIILAGNRPVGQVNYNEINRENNSVELDIIIAEDMDKDRGYGTDALKILTGYLLDSMNIRLCWIEPVAGNTRAVKAYEKAGFRTTRKFTAGDVECYHMELRASQQDKQV